MITIKSYKGMNRTPAVYLATKGWLELYEKGLVDDTICIQWDCDAIVAFDGDLPVGVLTYSEKDWCKETTITVGYVLPEFRRRGIYNTLWNELIKKCQEKDIVIISSYTSVNNVDMNAFSLAAGRELKGHIYHYRVPPNGEKKDGKPTT